MMTVTSSNSQLTGGWARIFNRTHLPTRRKKKKTSKAEVRALQKQKSKLQQQQLQPLHNTQKVEPLLQQLNLSGRGVGKNDNEEWGSPFTAKKESHIRIGFQNIGSQRINRKDYHSEATTKHIVDSPYDAFLFAEHGLNLVKLPPYQSWKERLPNYHSILSHNCRELSMTGMHQYGGTGMTLKEEMIGRKIDQGRDESGLGRWVWCYLQGKDNLNLRLIAAYRPCKNKKGEESVWNQHQRYWHTERRPVEPIQAFDEDLHALLLTWKDAGDQIILGMDANEDVRTGPLSMSLRSLNLEELITSLHSDKSAPATQNRNTSRRPIDGIWATPRLSAIAGGYLAFGGGCPSDHRTVWIDIPTNRVFGSRPQHLQPAIQRRISTKDPRLRKRYLKLARAGYKDHNIGPRQLQLKLAWENDVISKTAFIAEYNAIDTTVLRIRQQAGQADKIARGGSAWSPRYQKFRDAIELGDRLVKQKSGIRTSATMIKRLARRLDQQSLLRCDLLQANQFLTAAYRQYQKAKPKSEDWRDDHLTGIADALAEENHTSRATEMIKMRTIERQRRMGRSAKRIRGTGTKTPVTKVTFTDALGTIVTCTDQATIVPACVRSNIHTQLQAIQTPFLQEPLLSFIGYRAELPGANDILNGCFVIPSGTDKYACELIREMEMPDRIRRAGPINVTVTPDNHRTFWRHQSATVSCDPSHLSFAHYKNGSYDPEICRIDAFLREAPMQLGFSPPSWQRITDVEILKKAKVYDVDKMRLIQLMVANFNTNNKLIGKRTLANAELQRTIARDQYGSRKHHKAAMAALNKRLTMDIWRQKRQSGIIAMNDAEGCFDRIAHPVDAIAMRRRGVPKETMECLLTTLQSARHCISTG